MEDGEQRSLNRRILFVDDEPDVLDGLENRLHRQKTEWDMVFVRGAEAALVELARSPFDLVVSDMRMPGMDGGTLLRRVQKSHPGTARVILSGYAELNDVVKAFDVAHQFVAKPCDGAVLCAVIDRACALQQLLNDPELRAVVGSLDRLPTAPEVYLKVTRELARKGATPQEIADTIQEDLMMSARLLQVVNSPHFGLDRPAVSVLDAISALGVDFVHSLILSTHILVLINNPQINQAEIDRIQKDSLLTARMAKRMMASHGDVEAAFSAALVHDIGQMLTAFPEKYRQALAVATAAGQQRSFAEIERAQFGATHAQVGGCLLGTWGLPAEIAEAVTFHQEPELHVGNGALTAVIHTASTLTEAWLENLPLSQARIDLPFLERVGLAQELPRWREIAAEILGGKPSA